MAEEANVKVFCRVRPPNEREGGSAGWMARHAGSQPVASSYVKKCVIVPASDPLQQTVFLHSKHAVPNSAPKTFTFDRAFGEDATQNDVFEVVGVPITQACLQGYNGTIFAYGQTGSGKTFTMQGPDHVIDMEANRLTDREFNLRGLVPRVFDYLFEDVVAKDSNTNVQHTFACSFLEIYNERVYDLLDGGSTKDAAGLQLRENGRKGVFVENLIESVVTNAKQAAELMTIGAQNRRVGQTAMNRESSRSHSVFILQIQSKETTPDGITKMRSSRFNLVDLAGSERQRNTEAAGDRLKEAGSINKSLSALGNVIMGLVEQSAGKNRHVHYRDSKLTFLLKDSLGGNSKTFMIATVSPAEDSSYETLSTLKFAQRAKLIRNNAVINEDSTGSVLVLQEEIQRLRRQLHQAHLESMQISQEPRLPLPPLTEISVSDTLAQCDPATDGRFRELEAAFATTIEKNSQLKRSYEHLQLREEHLKSLCSEMKRNITHLKMVLRLRSGSPVSSEDIDQESMEYEPSVDAIEWRLKCEEAEENLAQLQDEIQQRRMSENFASFDRTARIEGEIENLNFMLLSLTKQLAYVVRDKHDLQDRLQQLSKATERDYTAEGSHSDSQLEISRLDSPLQLTLNNQAREYDAKLNTLLAALAAAEDKAKDASFELLHMKQKEAAWNIHDKERNLKLQDAANMLREVEEAKRFADDVLKQEKQHHCERLLLAEREKEQVTLELEAKFANLLTSNQQLASDYETLKEESKRLAEARGHFEKVSGELAGQLESKIAEINDLQTSYNDEVTAKEKLEASFDVYKSRTVEHIGELEKTISEKSSSLDALQSELAGMTQEYTDRLEALEKLSTQARSDYEEKLEVKAKENAELSSVAEGLKTALAAMEETNTSLRSELSTSQMRLNEMCQEIELIQTNLSSANQKLQEFQASIQESTQVINELRTNVTNLEDVNESIRQDVLSNQSEIESLLAEKAKTERELSESHNQLTESRERNSFLAGELEQVRAEFDKMSMLNTELANQLSNASNEVSALKDSESLLQGTKIRLEKRLAETEDTLVHSEQKLTSAINDHDSEKKRLHEEFAAKIQQLTQNFERSFQSKDDELTQLQSNLEYAVQASEKKLAEMQTSYEERIAEMENSSTVLQKEYSEKLSNLHADIKLRQSENDELSSELTQLREEFEEVQKEKDELLKVQDGQKVALAARDHGIAQLQQQVKEVIKTRDEQHAKLEEQATLIGTLLANVDDLKHKMKDQESHSAGQAAALKQRDEEIEQLEQSVVSEKEEKALLIQEKSELNALLANLTERCKGLDSDLQTATTELQRAKNNLQAEEARSKSRDQEFEKRAIALESEIERANELNVSQKYELEKFATQAETLKSDVQLLKRSQSAQNAEHESEVEVLHIRLKELEQQIESKNSLAIEAEQIFYAEKRSLNQRLEEAEHELMKQTYSNKELIRTGEQLGLTVEEQRTKLKSSKDKLVGMEKELERSSDAIRQAKSELAAKELSISDLTAVLAQLQAKRHELEQENSDLKKDQQVKSDLANLADELDRRSAEVAEKESQVEVVLKRAEQDSAAAASARKEFETIKNDYKKCRTRLEELEFLIIQLKNDKKKLEQEVQMQSQRLENISHENDKLMGHDNKRQKIQYHFRVKEENNRLLGEVRQLTDEKFKLETRLEKMKLALKEKENVGENVISKRPVPLSSKSSATSTGASSTSTAARQAIAKKLIPVSSGSNLESSSLSTPKPNKKRLHSRIERS